MADRPLFKGKKAALTLQEAIILVLIAILLIGLITIVVKRLDSILTL